MGASILPGILLAALTFAAAASVAASAAASEGGPVEAARRHLEAGELDEVLLALEREELPAARRGAAARTLAEAARSAWRRKDGILALHLAEAALRYDAKEALALEIAARASLGEQQLGPGKDYARRFAALRPGSPVSRLLSAEIASAEGQWSRTLEHLRALKPAALDDRDGLRAAELRHQAEQELRERAAAKRPLTSASPAKPGRGSFNQLVSPEPPPPPNRSRSRCGR